MFERSLVALITPFRNGTLDEPALRHLVDWHIASGTDGLVPVGTTGESSTLTAEEHWRVVKIVVAQAAGRVPVLAGAGSNCTAEAIDNGRLTAKSGADAALHVTGYYNRPAQEGLYKHFEAIANASGQAPFVVYNVPARTVADIAVDTMLRIAALPGAIGVKDATDDLARPVREQLHLSTPFTFLSGHDPTAVAYNASGGNGCISVTANVAPELCAQMQRACSDGDFAGAMQIQARLMTLHDALFLEPSPAGAKFACALLGLCAEECRLPIVPLGGKARETIRDAMQNLALI